MSSPSPLLITFSPEQFIIFVIAIVSASVGIILWVYKQTHPMDKRLDNLEKDITNIKKDLDDQKPKFRDMELLVARMTERISMGVRSTISEDKGETK